MKLNSDSLLLPFGKSPENRQNFKRLVSETQANGRTPLKQSVKTVYRELSIQCGRQLGYGTYHVIIVTDGASSDGEPLPRVRWMVNESTIEVHVVGFHLDDHSLNAPDCVDYHTAKSAEQLAKAFEAVAAESEDFVSPAEFEGL